MGLGKKCKKNNSKSASQSEVVYEPIQVIMPPEPADFDSDGDGYWDVDENLNSQSDSTTQIVSPLILMVTAFQMLLKFLWD